MLIRKHSFAGALKVRLFQLCSLGAPEGSREAKLLLRIQTGEALTVRNRPTPMPGANNKDEINQCFLKSDSNDTFFIEMADHFIMPHETEVFTFSLE